jgi:hypothetical protein
VNILSENNKINQTGKKDANSRINLALSIALFLWILLMILLEAFANVSNLYMFGSTIIGGPAIFLAGLISTLLKKSKNNPIWITSLVLYIVSGALIITYGIVFA